MSISPHWVPKASAVSSDNQESRSCPLVAYVVVEWEIQMCMDVIGSGKDQGCTPAKTVEKVANCSLDRGKTDSGCIQVSIGPEHNMCSNSYSEQKLCSINSGDRLGSEDEVNMLVVLENEQNIGSADHSGTVVNTVTENNVGSNGSAERLVPVDAVNTILEHNMCPNNSVERLRSEDEVIMLDVPESNQNLGSDDYSMDLANELNIADFANPFGIIEKDIHYGDQTVAATDRGTLVDDGPGWQLNLSKAISIPKTNEESKHIKKKKKLENNSSSSKGLSRILRSHSMAGSSLLSSLNSQ